MSRTHVIDFDSALLFFYLGYNLTLGLTRCSILIKSKSERNVNVLCRDRCSSGCELV